MTAMKDASPNTNMHSAFKREILRLRDGLRKADLSDAKTTEGLARRYKFFSVTLHHHHQAEDTFLWPNTPPESRSAGHPRAGRHGGRARGTGFRVRRRRRGLQGPVRELR